MEVYNFRAVDTFMQPQPQPLNVYVHHDANDRQMARMLSERLSQDGVQVLDDRQSDVQTLVRDSHVVLFCVSKQFNKAELRTRETQFVLEAVTTRRWGNTRLLPVRLEDCNTPASLRRWQSVDLFEANGYERLMIALKLRADQVGATLTVRDDWRLPFIEQKPEPQAELNKKSRSGGWNTLFGIALSVLLILVSRNFISTAPTETPVPAEVLAANATQSSLNYDRDRASTLTADAMSISVPWTQTAAYLTQAPLTQTAEYVISLYTATTTLTPTSTPTPRTIVELPTEIMDGNNVPMVLVLEGGFQMGDDNSHENVKPAYNIYLLAYYIDKFEVTNAVYEPCVSAGVCQPPRSLGSETRSDYYGNADHENHPVLNVDWQMANQFCEWRGARLPTEAEWEKAARGTDARPYPWGRDAGCSFANYLNGSAFCVGDTTQIGQSKNGRSAYGAFDMAGNVFEWVSSLYAPYPYNAVDGREDITASGSRILRGGSWRSSPDGIATFFRLSVDPDEYAVVGNDIGFRCARDATP